MADACPCFLSERQLPVQVDPMGWNEPHRRSLSALIRTHVHHEIQLMDGGPRNVVVAVLELSWRVNVCHVIQMMEYHWEGVDGD